jgi:thiol:disulfide interchange protein DsbC
MFKPFIFAFIVISISLTGLVFAFEQTSEPEKSVHKTNANAVEIDTVKKNASPHFDAEKLKKQFFNNLGLAVISINPSPMTGLVELVTDKGLFYASNDGQFLIQGKLYGVGSSVTNHSDESLAEFRRDGLAKFTDGMIVYPAKDEKHVVTVFTDITCGFCRKMHEQMDNYNELGITIRYLAYPRAGVKDRLGQYTQGFKDLRSIWCHENPEEALTKAKSGSTVAQRICDNPVEAEFNFGRQMGVSGTPAIILENGMMMPGYQEPDKLIAVLEQMKAAS